MMVTPKAKDDLPGWLQWSVGGILAIVIVLMPFHAFLSTWAGSALGHIELWKSWKEYLLVVISVPLAAWLTLKPSRWKALFADRLAWWLIGFVAILTVVTLLNHTHNSPSATLAGLAIDGRYPLIFALGYVVFRFGRWEWSFIRRKAASFILGAGVLVSVLGIVQVNLLPNDFLSHFGYEKGVTIAPFTLIDQNPDAPRAFATLRGPNDFAAFLILPLVISLCAARRNRWWFIATAIFLFALFESASRSAWLGALLAITCYAIFIYGKDILRSRHWKIGLIAALTTSVLLVFSAVTVPAIRLEIFHSSPSDTSLTEGSTDAHWQATINGMKRIVDHPLGCGAGCAGPASYYGDSPQISENYYVQIAEETGIIGLLIWVGLAATVGRRLWRCRQDYLVLALFTSFIGLSLVGFWLHVWADDPLSLTWWGFAGMTLGYYARISYDKQKLKNK